MYLILPSRLTTVLLDYTVIIYTIALHYAIVYNTIIIARSGAMCLVPIRYVNNLHNIIIIFYYTNCILVASHSEKVAFFTLPLNSSLIITVINMIMQNKTSTFLTTRSCITRVPDI